MGCGDIVVVVLKCNLAEDIYPAADGSASRSEEFLHDDHRFAGALV
jgi:hypothetical protein